MMEQYLIKLFALEREKLSRDYRKEFRLFEAKVKAMFNDNQCLTPQLGYVSIQYLLVTQYSTILE